MDTNQVLNGQDDSKSMKASDCKIFELSITSSLFREINKTWHIRLSIQLWHEYIMRLFQSLSHWKLGHFYIWTLCDILHFAKLSPSSNSSFRLELRGISYCLFLYSVLDNCAYCQYCITWLNYNYWLYLLTVLTDRILDCNYWQYFLKVLTDSTYSLVHCTFWLH